MRLGRRSLDAGLGTEEAEGLGQEPRSLTLTCPPHRSQRFPASTYGRLTLLCVIVEAIVVITLAAVVTALLLRNADLVADTPAKGTPVYLIVFCVGLLYQTVIAADAVRVLPGIIWKSWRVCHADALETGNQTNFPPLSSFAYSP